LNLSTEDYIEHILVRLSNIEKENAALIKDNTILISNLGLVNIDLKSDMQILRDKYNTLQIKNNVNPDNSIDNNIDMSEI